AYAVACVAPAAVPRVAWCRASLAHTAATGVATVRAVQRVRTAVANVGCGPGPAASAGAAPASCCRRPAVAGMSAGPVRGVAAYGASAVALRCRLVAA